MKFSIVITTYNRLALLKRAISSALAQTIDCEVVVADDCSTDGTAAYVQELIASLPEEKRSQVIYCCTTTNAGHSAVVNIGVDAAQGEWIKPLDDDDYLAPNYIEIMADILSLRSEAVICSCQAAQVDANGVELSRTRKPGPGRAFYIPQADVHYGMLLERIPFGTPVQVMFRRDAFLKSGGWDLSLSLCDDIDSWIKITQFGDAVFVNECLAYRTLWEGSENKKFSLQKRLEVNILMKQKLYVLIPEQHRAGLPSLSTMQDYLKLHWGVVALKQKQVAIALQLAFPAALSPAAWQLLFSATSARKQTEETLDIRKLVLAES
jgi:glycosyltransferase involved in cell wall biosynthesis